MKTSTRDMHLNLVWRLRSGTARARNALACSMIGASAIGEKAKYAYGLLQLQEAQSLLAERYEEIALPHSAPPDGAAGLDGMAGDFRARMGELLALAERLRDYRHWAGSELVGARTLQLLEAALRHTRGVPVAPLAPRTECPLKPGRAAVHTFQDYIRYPVDGDYIRRKLHQQAFNVEVCAAEVCAMLPLRFADLPPRAGLAMAIQCLEEVRHAEMLVDALREEGGDIGETPISLGIWDAARGAASALECIGLEQVIGEGFSLGADLFYAALYQRMGRADIGALHEDIHLDEVNHVRSGLRWFRELAGPEHAQRLEALEQRSGSKPMAGDFFGEEYRRFVGFSEAEIGRQRARAVPVELPAWGGLS